MLDLKLAASQFVAIPLRVRFKSGRSTPNCTVLYAIVIEESVPLSTSVTTFST